MAEQQAVVEQPASEGRELPNKFLFPEFAGFAGEDLLHEIVSAILPLSLLRTWEIFERKHAYDNDCFQSLGTVARKARRTLRTVNRNIATFLARGLLVLRSEYKVFPNADGALRKKAVVVKDFSGLYALAHEYYLWQFSENYLAPEHEYVEHIQADPHLQAKLCRFEDYRRFLDHHRDPFAQVEEDRRFTEYQEGYVGTTIPAEDAIAHLPGQNETKNMSKDPPKGLSKVSEERIINEKAYDNNLGKDSFDSGENLERRGEADAIASVCSQKRASVAEDYTKAEKRQNESSTNPPILSQRNGLPCVGKTRKSDEISLDVRQVMTSGFTPGQSTSCQAQEMPPKHPLARSFIQEVAGLFGDLNTKGSKTGIERVIETFELDQPADVLVCLVRAYVVARDTKEEKIRHRHPQSKAANRMPLFCTMFGRFAQAIGSGSTWQYSWEQMLSDIEADDRLGLWVSEHQRELAGDETEVTAPPVPEAAEEAVETLPEKTEATTACEEQSMPEAAEEGWKKREDAYDWAAYLLNELVNNDYGNVTVELSLPKRGTRYSVLVQDTLGQGYRLMSQSDVDQVVAMARNRTFSTTSTEASS